MGILRSLMGARGSDLCDQTLRICFFLLEKDTLPLKERAFHQAFKTLQLASLVGWNFIALHQCYFKTERTKRRYHVFFLRWRTINWHNLLLSLTEDSTGMLLGSSRTVRQHSVGESLGNTRREASLCGFWKVKFLVPSKRRGGILSEISVPSAGHRV